MCGEKRSLIVYTFLQLANNMWFSKIPCVRIHDMLWFLESSYSNLGTDRPPNRPFPQPFSYRLHLLHVCYFNAMVLKFIQSKTETHKTNRKCGFMLILYTVTEQHRGDIHRIERLIYPYGWLLYAYSISIVYSTLRIWQVLKKVQGSSTSISFGYTFRMVGGVGSGIRWLWQI